MRVSFIKDKTKKYVCDNCNKQFNWDGKSVRWGNLEYSDAEFCSDKCIKEWKKTN